MSLIRWNVAWTAGLLALVLAACQPAEVVEPADSQAAYVHSGCEDGLMVCPQDLALMCAIKIIHDKYNQCESDSECVLAGLAPNCMSVGSCPPHAVRKADVTAFRAETEAELDAYCETPSCRLAGVCAYKRSMFHAACEEGRCVTKVQ